MSMPVRLLTVDDEEGIREGIAAYFEDAGYIVSEASDGMAALEVIRQSPPDIIITDLRMPRMDGLELINLVIAEYDNIPIIVLSGTGVLADAIDALRRGAWDYLTKPIQDLGELEIMVQRSLEKSRLVSENRRYQLNLEEIVTERTRELRKLFTAVEQSVNAVVITDINGSIEYANPRFCNISGYSLPEIIGKNPSILKSDYTSAKDYEKLWQTIKAGQEWHGEFQNRRKNGTLYWEQCSIAPLRDDKGEITNFVGIKEDITIRKAQEEVLNWQASHDILTGLHNRYYLESHISSKLMSIDKDKEYLSLILIDVDNLKFVNDTFGHDYGDRLLVEISKRLKKLACTDCMIARFLGDQFVMIPVVKQDSLYGIELADKIRKNLSELFNVDGVEVAITVSIGVATFPDDGETVDNMLRNAEAAMYEAKRQGRNLVINYTNEFHKRAQHRLMLETRLHRALENKDFNLHYQPQISLETRKVVGLEALLRWTPADMPSVSPAEFIPILEETSLIVPVGTWVLYEACHQAVLCQRKGMPTIRVSVNISAVQFQRGDLAETVRLVLAETGLEPSSLCLELTESMLMIDTNHAKKKLEELCKIGVILSLDDFGTGYSSLAYLSRLPVHELKIDQSFISRLHDSKSDTALVNTIIVMAQELGLKIVAEGVETEEQMRHLLGRDCTTIQGFLYSRPLPFEQLEIFIKEWKMK